jgi:hypothetical protein
MRKQLLRVVIALIGVAGSAIAARAIAIDHIVVNIPYEFVVSGKTLPAGNYRVVRASDSNPGGPLVLSSLENHVSALVLPVTFEGSETDNAYIAFDVVGDQHFLSQIKTADHFFRIPVPRSAEKEGAMKSHNGMHATVIVRASN